MVWMRTFIAAEGLIPSQPTRTKRKREYDTVDLSTGTRGSHSKHNKLYRNGSQCHSGNESCGRQDSLVGMCASGKRVCSCLAIRGLGPMAMSARLGSACQHCGGYAYAFDESRWQTGEGAFMRWSVGIFFAKWGVDTLEDNVARKAYEQ